MIDCRHALAEGISGTNSGFCGTKICVLFSISLVRTFIKQAIKLLLFACLYLVDMSKER